MDLSGNPQSLVVNLGGNTASVAAGLSSPSLSFIGSTDSVILGSAASTVQYALQASSGVETIGNFILGQDALDIDLLGQPNTSLVAFDTTVNGAGAIALASSADLTHGVVLLNTGSQTASDLLAAHTTFAGGHALIS
jgi:hypothetical protein